MRMTEEFTLFDIDEQLLGEQIFECIADLFPICRSITGNGVRKTLSRLQQIIPLELHEVPSGTQVFDWTVPDEWNISDAYIKDSQGRRVVDFRCSSLHVMNYSVPFHGRMSLDQLRPHLFALPEHPDWIPYRTSYYQPNWGFCLSQNQLDGLADGEYEVCIDSTLEPGSLTYGETYLRGESPEEVLISCHLCHPSLANDNLSGVAIAAHLARHLQELPLRFSYRFLFIPATIGSITWLARNPSVVPNIRHGLVLACLGDLGSLTYKRSRRGDVAVDRAAAHILRQSGKHEILSFSPYGYDERQYCSPGFDLPLGRLSRTPHGQFPEYHTSADNLSFVQPSQLAASLATCLSILFVLEKDRTYTNLNPCGEPQLSKHGLYRSVGGTKQSPEFEMALLWVLNLSDGRHSLLDIAERSEIRFQDIVSAANALCDCGLLKETSSSS